MKTKGKRVNPRTIASKAKLRWQIDLPPAAEPDSVVRARAGLRILWVAAAIGASYLALLTQASIIMLLPDEQLEAKASVQFESAVQIEGRRGDVLDRNGQILATTVDLVEVRADPARIDPDGLNPERISQLSSALAPLIGEPASTIAEKLGKAGRRDVLLARGLTPDQADAVRAVMPREGIFLSSESRRYYPGRADAATLLGVVGRNGEGLAGLEQTYNRYLTGETYRYVQWRDRKGRQIEPKAPTVQPGNTIVLSLDRQIQRVVETALDHGMERMKPLAMHAIVMDVKTGEILAMANRPTQNNNDTSALNMEVFKNRAVMDAFEPGSVFKPFIAAAAMESGLVTPESPIDCEGGTWTVATKTIHDDHPHGVVSLAEVIKYSSNIGAAKLAFQLGTERTINFLTDFGFGRMSGLGLPGETRGAMRPAGSIKPIELATTAYGHGVSANTLQLTAAVSTLANGGVRMKPILVKEIRDAHGEVVLRNDPEVDRRVVSEDTARKTVLMMEEVTEEGGTGTKARVSGYKVAGKTGTAWKHVNGGYSSTDRVGSFVGVLPADAPRLAIVVVVDSPSEGSRYGGLTAGPVFSEIGASAMRLMGVPPDPALIEKKKKPAVAASERSEEEARPPLSVEDAALVYVDQNNVRLPDLTGMSLRDALSSLQGAGLSVAVRGTGRVATQSPTPGTPLAPGAAVEVVLQ